MSKERDNETTRQKRTRQRDKKGRDNETKKDETTRQNMTRQLDNETKMTRQRDKIRQNDETKIIKLEFDKIHQNHPRMTWKRRIRPQNSENE